MRVLPQAENVLSVSPESLLVGGESKGPLYRPASKIPLKGSTELTKEERHTMHLRKKRLRRAQSKGQEARLQAVARLDGKTQKRVERKEAMAFLSRQRNVTIEAKQTTRNKKTTKKNIRQIK